ncbi:MAG: FtsW/RodA/SpoVE family cell cycle protein [Bacteroidales bacterium]|nr:FtsW/RodA/SpoVE family cell cycle protein [Bacteroidales bacterium]MDY6347684.1 FtsW/RodA/SpoVE family cell cycle protein [Bacteroidales bacterium]
MGEEPEITERRISFKSDKIIPIVVLFLTGLSILMVYSMKGAVVLQHLKHLLFAYAGMFVCYQIKYKYFGAFSPVMILGAIVLLGATLTSQTVRGVTFMGREVQTFYLIGFMLIIFMSNFIGRKYEKQRKETMLLNHGAAIDFELDNKTAWGMYGVLCLFCLCIAVLNMSTSIILFITGIAILFVGGTRLKEVLKMVSIVAAALVIVVVIVANMSEERRADIGRIATFINRWEYFITNDNTDGYGDQMILARTAIARSGLHPAGPGNGVIKNRLPEKETDYAFASMFEETGIVVGVLIIFSYLIIFFRAWNIAKNAGGFFGRLLAFGIGFWFTAQAFVHIGVNCELLPATGQTLPFISSGGSSLFVSGCAMGILLNVAKISKQEEQDKKTINVMKAQ